MRKFVFVEPGEDGVTPIEVVVTEEDIIANYWPYWKLQAVAHDTPKEDITHENCIDDFIVIHWATEFNDG